MQCPFCKEEIQEGALKCKHCGSMLDNSTSTTFTGQQGTIHKSWWKYMPLTDKSIKPIDKALWIVYVALAYLIPISAVISLLIVYLVRNKYIHNTYKKAATFSIILIALLSFAAGFMKALK